MPASYDSMRLRHQKNMDRRLTADHAAMARQIAMLVVRSAGLDGLVPNTRSARETLRTAIWETVVKPYYVGSGNEPLDGPRPQSPYALLLVEGITQATRIQAERQAAIVRRVVKDPVVLAWLTGPRPFAPVREMRGTYEPFHLFVDQNGYRLSDRIWRTSIDVRSRIDRLLSYHISRGTSAVQIADLLEPFLTPTALRQRTQTPYGTEGSFAARRLARTEITAASGRATINASAANPFVDSLQWRLSASHPRIDHCDVNASGGPNGDGIYPLGEVPRYPDHPHCCPPGQMVTTELGNVAIEDIRKGDKVLTHKGRYRRVLAAWATPHDGTVYSFETERGGFELTGNHPVLTPRGWVNAECVQLGDEVLYTSVNVAIQAIQQRHYTGPVYNMEVADDHTYTVNGAAVHNCLCSLLPVPRGSTADLVASLRADIDAARPRARAFQGLFNVGYLVRAILGGFIDDVIDTVRGVFS